MTQQDYYQILGVDRDADAKRIKDAYRDRAFKYHPDRNASTADSAEMMKRLNEAYAVLSNPEKRRAYDAMRNRFGDNAYGRFRSTYTERDIFSGSDVHQIFEEMARSFGLRGVDSIFSDFYGPGFKSFEFNRHGVRGRGFVYRGGFGVRQGRRMAGGAPPLLGRWTKHLLQKITGLRLPQTGEDIYDTIHLSAEFASRGGPFPYHHQRRDKKLVINVPANTRDGQQIRLAQMGAVGKDGGPPGDLYLRVKIRKPLLQKAKDFVVSALGR